MKSIKKRTFITEYGVRNGRRRKWKRFESARKREIEVEGEEQEVRRQNKTRKKSGREK